VAIPYSRATPDASSYFMRCNSCRVSSSSGTACR
jgi:hypothetical protein